MLPNEDDCFVAAYLAECGKSCKAIFRQWEKQPELKAQVMILDAILSGLDKICALQLRRLTSRDVDRLELPSDVTDIVKKHYRKREAKRVLPARVRQLTASPAAAYQPSLFKEMEDEQCYLGATSEVPTQSSAPKKDGKA